MRNRLIREGLLIHLRIRLEDLNREWYLKDDWFYTGCDWNMGYEGYQTTLPSATLDYDNGEGEYKTLFEWIYR